MAMDVNVKVTIDFPAMDKLVDLIGAKARECLCAVSEKAAEIETCEDKVIDIKLVTEKKQEAKEAPKPEPVVEEATENAAGPAVESEPVPDVPERVYTAEELANAAMKLRDIDKENSAKIKAHFPELGIKSIGDLRSNAAARRPFAELLISLGAEL